jgi:hypothetical protein
MAMALIGYDGICSNDKGIISPTAAISLDCVYTAGKAFIRNLYENYKTETWGVAGFYDAHSQHYQWTAQRYFGDRPQ